jgi:hypothetical protein
VTPSPPWPRPAGSSPRIPSGSAAGGRWRWGLYRTGRQSEALAAVARLRRTLADELGLDPAPETAAFEAGILRHDPALTFAPAPESVAVLPPVPDRADDGLLGRDAALAAVDRAVAAAGSGRGALLVLEAAAGAGKTTLLRATAERVTATGGNARARVGRRHRRDAGVVAVDHDRPAGRRASAGGQGTGGRRRRRSGPGSHAVRRPGAG